jgi:hypothetical protein
MAPDQDWCLHCGAGSAGALSGGTSLAPMAGIIAVSILLLLGAAAAAYAALKEEQHKPPPHLTIVAAPAPQLPAATATAPTATVPTAPVPPAETPSAALPPSLPTTSSKPPKIPVQAHTPEHETSKGEESTPATGSTPTAPNPAPKGPMPILLDTNAASTYNPNGFPESDFGDPTLAIDGETTTAWTAQVQPGAGPLVNAGLLVNLNANRHLAKLKLITSTPGLTVRIYGARGAHPPAAITDPAWTQLTAERLVKKKRVGMTLQDATKSFRYVLAWIVKAPASAGTAPSATQTSSVSLDEVMLFPAPNK